MYAAEEQRSWRDVVHGERIQDHHHGAHRVATNMDAKLENPLRGISQKHLMADVEVFARERGLTHILPELKKGALVAQDADAYLHFDIFTYDDRFVLEDEVRHKWRQTGALYYMVIMSSLAAAVQGMDEAVINGAQLIYPGQFGIDIHTSGWSASLIVHLISAVQPSHVG
ncbi:hypothetical protein ID866_9871 [Astraeus odoratus]|nr:hypothetical protein ID866_9871 [Astraeus odoratus]